MTHKNVIACLAKDLQNQIFLYPGIILSDGMHKTVQKALLDLPLNVKKTT